MRKTKERFRKNLDEVWPFWDSVFADPYRNGPWAMVSKYRHPYVLARKRKADVVALLEANGIHGKRADAMADKAMAYAKDCVSGALESSPEVESLGRWMAGVESAAAEDAAVMGKMVAMLEGNRDFEHLKEIRGIARGNHSRRAWRRVQIRQRQSRRFLRRAKPHGVPSGENDGAPPPDNEEREREA